MTKALMDEVRQRSNSHLQKLPKYAAIEGHNRTYSFRNVGSKTTLTGTDSMTGLNNTFGQTMITSQIGSQAEELMKI